MSKIKTATGRVTASLAVASLLITGFSVVPANASSPVGIERAVSVSPDSALKRVSYKVKTTANLNVRKTSSVRSSRLTTVPKNYTLSPSGQASNGWFKVNYKGKTGYVSNKYVKKVSTTSKPAPKPKPKPSSNKARIKTSYKSSYAGMQYAIIDGGVNWSKPVKKMTFLDGDYWNRGYSKSVSEWPSGGKGKSMAKVAADSNMVLVIPRIPAYQSNLGWTWWGNSSGNAVKLKKLDSYLDKKIGTSKANSWYMGYSGGAEYITYELAKRGQGSYGNGGAILLAGGGNPKSISNPPSAFKKNFDMHWFVGSKDGAGQSSNAQSWSAYKASAEGQKFYKSKGFKTTRTVLNGQNHHSYNLASVMNAGLAKAGL